MTHLFAEGKHSALDDADPVACAEPEDLLFDQEIVLVQACYHSEPILLHFVDLRKRQQMHKVQNLQRL